MSLKYDGLLNPVVVFLVRQEGPGNMTALQPNADHLYGMAGNNTINAQDGDDADNTVTATTLDTYLHDRAANDTAWRLAA